uniref:Uncharacterized protein n=1 Tax=Gossypium raimondii TaxID=29730 RepID=A0A0D2TQV0_GOSRA|nr:hypothetical protein B456_009G245700 [Gossypium raimondii]
MMNGYREDNSCCYFHPKQVVIGVCPLCLNERLLVLASKQGQRSSSSSSTRAGRSRFLQGVSQKKPHIYLPNIFAFGSLLNRPQPHLNHLKPQDFDDHDASTSQEGISISTGSCKNWVFFLGTHLSQSSSKRMGLVHGKKAKFQRYHLSIAACRGRPA